MNRSVKVFIAFALIFSFYILLCGCSNKSMFLNQAKSAIKAFNDNEIYFPDINEDILSDIIETEYVSLYNNKQESYDYALSFDAADTFKIDYAGFTGGVDDASKEYAESLKKFIVDSLKKPENIDTKKSYTVKCSFEKNDGEWVCKIDPEDINNIKSALDLYAERVFEEKIKSSEEYRTIVARELKPLLDGFTDSQFSYTVSGDIESLSVTSGTSDVKFRIFPPDFASYQIENPDALLPAFDFKNLTLNPLNDYYNIFHENLKEFADKKESRGSFTDINFIFSRNPDGEWEYDESDAAIKNSVTDINNKINLQSETAVNAAKAESDIIYILSRYYSGDMLNDYPEYLNCTELADFIKVEDIKLAGAGKYDITLKYPAIDELTKVAETNFLNSITKKYYNEEDIQFNKDNITEFYNKDDIAKITTDDTVSFTYDKNISAVISDKDINSKFETMMKSAIEESNAKWLVEERSYPSSGVIYNNSGGGNSFINFYKFPGADICFYKLFNSSDKLVVTVFLNTDSDSVGLYIPSGSYYLKYSYGTKWYGLEDAFGSSGHYGKSEPFVVQYGYMYDYTFVYSGGNTDLDAIDMSVF